MSIKSHICHILGPIHKHKEKIIVTWIIQQYFSLEIGYIKKKNLFDWSFTFIYRYNTMLWYLTKDAIHIHFVSLKWCFAYFISCLYHAVWPTQDVEGVSVTRIIVVYREIIFDWSRLIKKILQNWTFWNCQNCNKI